MSTFPNSKRSLSKQELLARLEEAEDTLRAIRSGEVDALIVSSGPTDQIFTLKEATLSYKVLIEELNEGVLILSLEGMILYCNSRFAEILGLPMEKILGEYFLRFVIPDDHADVARILAGSPQGRLNIELTLSSGKAEVPVGISLREVMLDGMLRLGAVISDLSERKRAEAELLRYQDHLEEMVSEKTRELNATGQKYTTLFDTTSDGVWIHNLKGEILEVNDAYCRMSGYTREELTRMPVSKLEAVESPEEITTHIKRLIAAGGHDRFESRHRRKDSTIFDVDLTALYFKNDGGQIAIFVRDITERKKMEARLQDVNEELQVTSEELRVQNEELLRVQFELRESEAKYRNLVENAPVGIYEIDLTSRKLITVNDVMCIVTGYPHEELLSMDALELLEGEHKKKFLDRIQRMISGQEVPANVEYQVRLKSGEVRWALLSVNFTRQNKIPVKARVIATDITERKRIEDALQGANKELKHFNNLMIGRELRMIELKKEVDELCRSAGRPPRYFLDFEKE